LTLKIVSEFDFHVTVFTVIYFSVMEGKG